MNQIEFENLKSCPYCQNELLIDSASTMDKSQVYCSLCQLRGPLATSPLKAQEAWNNLPRHADSVLHLLREINNQKKHVALLTDGLTTQQELWGRAEKSMLKMAGIVKMQNALLEQAREMIYTAASEGFLKDEAVARDFQRLADRIADVIQMPVQVLDEVNSISQDKEKTDGR